jgi:hypothetical protein
MFRGAVNTASNPWPAREEEGWLSRAGPAEPADGSLFASAADVAWALRDRAGCSKARLHLRLDGATLLPVRLSVGGKGQSEASVAREAIEPGTIYVTDRGFEHFPYLHAVLDGNADVVLRVKMTLNFTARAAQALDADDAAAGLLSDRVGRLDGSPHCKPPQQELRELVVFDERQPDQAAAPGHEPARRPGPDRRAAVPPPLADRAVLPLAEGARPLRAPAQPQQERHDAGVPRGGHRDAADLPAPAGVR